MLQTIALVGIGVVVGAAAVTGYFIWQFRNIM